MKEKYNSGGFVSPFRSISHIGDPVALYDAATEKYYIYCTGGRFQCWSSPDLIEFTAHGDAYGTTERSFGTQNYWAPEVYKRGDVFYMVYSAARILENGKKRHSIGIASSRCPTGPFIDLYDHPLFAPDCSVIDASLLFDEDGEIYLFYSRDCSENVVDGKRTSQVFGVRVAPDFSGVLGTPVLLATPTSPWEVRSGDVVWNEGPCVLRQDGRYVLLFTANYYASVHYCVGYAVSDFPLGPYEKAAENPILKGDGVYTSGTGHCNYLRSPDGSELYMVYHSHSDVTNTTNPVADRTPCFDKMVFRRDGRLTVNGPTVARQPYPSGTRGYCKLTGRDVSVASSYPSTDSLRRLTDGIVDHRGDAADVYRFDCAVQGEITLAFARPTALESLWIYGAADGSRDPAEVRADADGQIRTADFAHELPRSPAVLCFDGSKVLRVALTFTPRDGATDAALSEIVIVEKRK
ncbi:MAG: glycoside hydrolase family 43 protein [Clostridia bacterium]|nr:glycoside hydrolase family 43 protein [Clostridia bacterium]